MSGSIIDLANLRLEMAREFLSDARALAEQSRWRSATNRVYYACFYAVSALLALDQKDTKKHSGVRSLFIKDYVKTGDFPVDKGKLYTTLLDAREDADYDPEEPLPVEMLPEWLEEVDQLIAQIAARIAQRTNNIR